jgi:hypothetical protein
LAHELTHFVYRDSFNPYRNNFTQSEFILSTIEGRGGELDAYIIECKVLKDIFPKLFKKRYRCKNIYNFENKTFSRKKGLMEFYSMGKHYKTFQNYIRPSIMNESTVYKLFPHLNSDSPTFISSVYGLPYPIAALKEYEMVKTKSCVNDQRRLLVLEKIWKVNQGEIFKRQNKTDGKDQVKRALASSVKSNKSKNTNVNRALGKNRKYKLYYELKKSFKKRCSDFYFD